MFAVIREWHAQGKPRTEETRHSFREWVQVVDWMAQRILGTVPIMDGHEQAQERVSNPAMVWLRKVVLAVVDAGEMDRPLTATDVHCLCDSRDIEIPGLRPGANEDKGKKVVGSIMAKLFRERDKLEVDAFDVTREEKYLSREDASSGGSFKSKTYTVTRR